MNLHILHNEAAAVSFLACTGVSGRSDHAVCTSAQASYALEAAGVEHTQGHTLYNSMEAVDAQGRIVQQILTFVGSLFERFDDLREDEDYFASAVIMASYPLQNLISRAVYTSRFCEQLLREHPGSALHVYEPEPVSDGTFERCFATLPWLSFLANEAEKYGCTVTFVPCRSDNNEKSSIPAAPPRLADGFGTRISMSSKLCKAVGNYIFGKKVRKLTNQLRPCRYLFFHNANREWSYPHNLLQANPALSVYRHMIDAGQESSPLCRFEPHLASRLHGDKLDVTFRPDTQDFPTTLAGHEELTQQFADWESSSLAGLETTICGVDYYPHIRERLLWTLAGFRAMRGRVTSMTESVLEQARPDMALFSCADSLFLQYFARTCTRRNIHTLCYEHSFGYATYLSTKDTMLEDSCVEFFLHHGCNDGPIGEPAVPRKSTWVPTGSSLIEQQRTFPRIRREKDRIRVLWIAEIAGMEGMLKIDETERYELDKKALTALLKNENLYITYRPLAISQRCDGTSSWIKDLKSDRIRVDSATAFPRLVQQCDMVLVMTNSPTTIGQCIAMGKPLIINDNIPHTRARKYLDDISQITTYATSQKEFLQHVEAFVRKPESYMRPNRRLQEAFYKRYMSGGNASPAMAALQFMKHLAGN